MHSCNLSCNHDNYEQVIFPPSNKTCNPFQCRNRIYAYVNRLDPGQPPSNSAAGLRSNLFATQSIIPNKFKQNLKVLKSRWQYNLFLENYPAFKGLTSSVKVLLGLRLLDFLLHSWFYGVHKADEKLRWDSASINGWKKRDTVESWYLEVDGTFFTSSNYPKCKLICTSGNLDL